MIELHDFNTCCLKHGSSATRERICISDCIDDGCDARRDERFTAWPSASTVRAGFKRHEDRRAARSIAGSAKRIDFCVRVTTTSVRAVGNDCPSGVSDDAANHRIWFDSAMPARGKPNRGIEQLRDSRRGQ